MIPHSAQCCKACKLLHTSLTLWLRWELENGYYERAQQSLIDLQQIRERRLCGQERCSNLDEASYWIDRFHRLYLGDRRAWEWRKWRWSLADLRRDALLKHVRRHQPTYRKQAMEFANQWFGWTDDAPGGVA